MKWVHFRQAPFPAAARLICGIASEQLLSGVPFAGRFGPNGYAFAFYRRNVPWGDPMHRRDFVALLGGAAAAWPLAAHAQQGGPMRRIGMLLGGGETEPQIVAGLAAFRKALAELGWIEGRNVQIDLRFAVADVDRMRVLVKGIGRAAARRDGGTNNRGSLPRCSAKPKPSPSCS